MLENKDMNMRNEEEVKEVKKLKKSYEEYKVNRENPDRKLSTENSFRRKIRHLIANTKATDFEKGSAMDILFYCITVEQHKDFLYQHVEESGNIIKTIENIDKAKARSVSEILVLNSAKEFLQVDIKDNGKKDKRRWEVILTIKEGELTLRTSVKYTKVEKYLEGFKFGKCEEFDGDKSFLGVKYLNKQQYFVNTLKESLNKLDEVTIALLMNNMKEE